VPVSESRPTLDTVAAAAGVSRMTVSNAYNRPDQLSAETRDRVLQVAQRLGYPGPDPAGRSLRRGRTGTIGAVLTERLPTAFGDPGTVSFLHGVATELGAHGQALLLLPSDDGDDQPLIRSAMVDGFVLVSLPPESPAVAAVVDRRLPMVSLGSPRLPGVPYLSCDNVAAAGEMARHLYGLGHRRFAVVTVGDPATERSGGTAPEPARHRGFRDRVRGFRNQLADLGVPDDAVEVVVAAGNGYEQARTAVAEVLGRSVSRRPSAVFAVTDVMALGVLAAAEDAGRAVPVALSVAGFDGVDAAARSRPVLTTVDQDLFGQGRSIARLVLDRVAGGGARPSRVTARLVVGGSTGRAPRRR
jgi:DNA-binding LacI/PurR family transcriptional regulator